MRRAGLNRLDWSLGCGTFAELMFPDGPVRLIETLWFTERETAVVILQTGDREIIAWPQTEHLVRVLPAEAACARVEIPPPSRIKVVSSWRRVDPFHSERHRSARFRALTELIRHRRLPCRYSLLHFAAGGEVGDWHGPCAEDPEQTAGNVAERLARTPGLSLPAALEAELIADALAATDSPDDARALIDRAGWSSVLGQLDDLLRGYVGPVSPPSPGTPPPAATAAAQLTLFSEGSR